MKYVPTTARADLAAIHEGHDDAAYRDFIWVRRARDYHGPLKPSWRWPLKRIEPTETVLNFSELRAKLRRQ